MSTSPFVVISSSEPQIVGPFPDEVDAIAFGKSWQAANNDDPRWQLSIVDDTYWEGRDVVRLPYDPSEERVASQEPKFRRNLSEFAADPQSWVSDLPFTNEMVRQAIYTFQNKIIDEAKKTGRTIDASPMMVAYDYDDLPDEIAAVLDEEARHSVDQSYDAEWKWDHCTEGYGDVAVVNFRDPNTAEIPYAIEDKGLAITLGGSELSSAQNLYLIPAHLVEEN